MTQAEATNGGRVFLSGPWRIALFAAALLWMALAPFPARSERFHAMVLPLWVMNFWLSGRRLDKRSLVFAFGIVTGVLFYLLGSYQAQQIGARFTLLEALGSLYFTLGLFAIYSVLCAGLTAPLRWHPSTRALLSEARGWWLRWARMAVALLIFVPYLYTTFNLHRFKYAATINPQSQTGLGYENVTLHAADGIALRGWFIPAPKSDKAVLLVHGIGANRGDVLGLVPFLHRAGFHVFAFDLRGHGDSSGHTTSFGVYEARDVQAAAAYVQARRDVKSVAVYAFSMGGSAVLHAVGENGLPGVQAVILDSTFARLEPLARNQISFLPGSIARPLLAMISFSTRLELGVGLSEIAPQRFISQIAPRPLLLIHGTADTLIPPIHARWNFAAARSPKELYIVPHAEHVAGFEVDGKAYEKRVVKFLREALAAKL